MKRKIIIASVLMLVSIVSAFSIIVSSPRYSIRANSSNTSLTLTNSQPDSERLSVSLAVYTDAKNACFYPTLTANKYGNTDTWYAPSGQKIVSWDESAVRCEVPASASD
jgi:hypothetical protein